MLKLIYKDLYQLRKLLLLYFGILLGLMLLSGDTANGAFGALYIVIAVYGLTLRSAYYEDKDQALVFLRTLPIKAKTIVIAKYATAALLLLFNGFFALAAVSTVSYLTGTPLEVDLFKVYLWTAAGVLVLLSTFLAMLFNWGYSRAVNWIRLLFLSFIFIPIIIQNFSQVLHLQNLNLVETLSRAAAQPVFPYLMTSAVLGIFLISMLFSIRGFKV